MDKTVNKILPNLAYEQDLWNQGYGSVCGMDEVGKGAWAGPLTIGVAIAGENNPPPGINDSKAITEKKREEMFDAVAEWCADWSVGSATPEECDELGMSEAQRLAAKRALENLKTTPDWALLDGKWDFLKSGKLGMANLGMTDIDTNNIGTNNIGMANLGMTDIDTNNIDTNNIGTTNIIKGDQTSLTIAAASILAKVSRDRMMREIGDIYGPYRFPYNKGYRCTWHLAALKAWGATPIHRKKWSFMSEAAFA